MFGPIDGPFIIPIVAILAWAAISIARIKSGGENGWQQDPRNMRVPPMFEKMLEKAMEERDAEIKALRERVEVLEKIVTDSYGSRKLSDEIDKLRDERG